MGEDEMRQAVVTARAAEQIPAMVQGYRDLKVNLECAAGCDEGVTPDQADSEIMSWGGSVMVSAYRNACAILSRIDGEG
jgi:hypothetical protein